MRGTLRADILHTFRMMKRGPLFVAVAMASLALGLGANTAIFSLMDQVLLRHLPVRDPGALVLLESPGANMGMFFGGPECFSYPMYVDIRDRNDVFEGVAARFPMLLNLQQGSSAEPVAAELVSGNYFDVLGVGAAIGRTLTQGDDLRKGEHRVAVLGYESWLRRFGGDPRVLGRDIRVNGQPMTVVGVAQSGFRGLEIGRRAEVFVPMMMKAQMTPTWDQLNDRRTMWVNIVARRKSGVTIERAEASLAPLYRPILEQEIREMPFRASERFVKGFMARRLELREGAKGVSGIRGQVQTPILLLAGMVGLVLLIACANVANLLMARAAARQKEFAIRLALGAGRWRIARQLLVESLLLSMMGGVVGLAVAAWALDLMVNFLQQTGGAETLSTALDYRVLGFSFLLSLVTGMAFGLLPAVQATRSEVAPTLKDQAANIAGGSASVRGRKILVAAQVALSLLLLVGSGLLLRSLNNLRSVDPGFRAENLISFRADAALAGYSPERVRQIYSLLEERLAGLPGVTAFGSSQSPMLSGEDGFYTVRVQGYESKEGEDMNPLGNGAGPGFFRTVGMPLLYGREFTVADAFGAPKVAVVNESFARHFFHGSSPLGRRFGIGQANDTFEIVGVVKDAATQRLREKPSQAFFMPWMQDEQPGSMTFYLRTGFDASTSFAAVRREVSSAVPGLAIQDMKTVSRQVDDSLANERLVASLCTLFGAIATLLAAVGLYGVTAFTVARRTREIGIRLTLGAERGSVLAMVLREVALLTLGGVIAGMPLAFWLTKFLESQLFGLSRNDPATVAASTALIIAVAITAGAVPAIKAAKVDPLAALRYE